MLAPARPVASRFARSTERSADVVPIHHQNNGDQPSPAPLAGIGQCEVTTTCRPRISASGERCRSASAPVPSMDEAPPSNASSNRRDRWPRPIDRPAARRNRNRKGTHRDRDSRAELAARSRRWCASTARRFRARSSRVSCSAVRGALPACWRGKSAVRTRRSSTIFLDEIGDLPLDDQVKLLRVLEERQIERLGSPKAVGVDVRIIAATHRNLERGIAEDAFRRTCTTV